MPSLPDRLDHCAVTAPAASPPSASPPSLWSRIGAVVRRIIGVPDYETYLASMAKHHPECMPLDARSFERDRLAARYRGPGTRCC